MKSFAAPLATFFALMASAQAADTVVTLDIPQQLASYPNAVSQLIHNIATQIAGAPKPLGDLQIIPFTMQTPGEANTQAPEQTSAPEKAPAQAPQYEQSSPIQASQPAPSPAASEQAPVKFAPRPEDPQPASQGSTEQVSAQIPPPTAAVIPTDSPIQTAIIIPSSAIVIGSTVDQPPPSIIITSPATIEAASGTISKTALTESDSVSRSRSGTGKSTSMTRTTRASSETSTESGEPTQTAADSAAGHVITGWVGVAVAAAMGGLLL